MVPDRKMEEIMSAGTPEEWADKLMQAALDAGGTDNITFIICGGEDDAWNQG